MSQLVKYEDVQGDLQVLIETKKLPAHIKDSKDAFLIQEMGRELGFPAIQAFHYIIPIQGRLTLATKALGAVLRRGGVEFTTLEDAVWVYSDGETNPIHTRPEQPVDRRTTIKFVRGNQVEVVFFLWSDATTQGLVGKDNWKRMPREMLYARCLTKGANRIGQDLTMGLYSTDEMVDALNVDLKKVKRDEDGFVSAVEETEYENV